MGLILEVYKDVLWRTELWVVHSNTTSFATRALKQNGAIIHDLL